MHLSHSEERRCSTDIHVEARAVALIDRPWPRATAVPAPFEHLFRAEYARVVRIAYRAMYRPANVSFLSLLVMGEDVVQPVQVTDRAGAVWVAYYAMQRQHDGSWRTSGCHLAASVRTIPA